MDRKFGSSLNHNAILIPAVTETKPRRYACVTRNEPHLTRASDRNDHLGPMTRTVLDNALLLRAIAGNDDIDDRGFGSPLPAHIPDYYHNLLKLENPKSLSGKKIGVITESLSMPAMDPRVLKLFIASAERFRALGASVEEASIPIHKQGAAIWTGISKFGGYVTKTGSNTGRRGHAMNDLSAKMWPLTQERWDNAYPRSARWFSR